MSSPALPYSHMAGNQDLQSAGKETGIHLEPRWLPRAAPACSQAKSYINTLYAFTDIKRKIMYSNKTVYSSFGLI